MAERVRAQDQPETLTIYTLKWHDDHAVGAAEDKDGEPANAQIFCIVHLDGKPIKCAVSAAPRYSSEFATVTLELAPSSVRIVECDAAEWEALS